MADVILSREELGFPWPTTDPFLFCVHHLDRYPAGNAALGPSVGLAGRHIGMDFELRDGWRMYHGDVVPGFPRHPHRGFETITLARQGLIDHSDSLGAMARFGQGDTQWMTAGKGIEHAEMFPLTDASGPNTGELFQLWLNLPRASKMVAPYFTMFWQSTIPRHLIADEQGRRTEVVTVSGMLGDKAPPPPPPDSWAAQAAAEIVVWTIKMEPDACFTLPAMSAGCNRTLYFFAGESVAVGKDNVDRHGALRLRADIDVPLHNGAEASEFLLLGGRPLAEPVAHYGPFVMNEAHEIDQAIADYRSTGFGEWPWDHNDPVHERDRRRFALHPDGRLEEP